jgi:NAD+ kinase
VSFEDERQAITRRRSSVVAEYQPLVIPGDGTTAAECLVHSLLEDHRSGPMLKAHDALDIVTNVKHPDKLNSEHRDSRLLSKKQLSEMAYGIRELAKNLSHMKLKLKVQNIFILGKVNDRTVILQTKELACWLLSTDDYRVYV